MRIDQFLASVYLGDRACKSVVIDGWNERVALVIDEISRVRSAAGTWDYYNDENVVDGALVFTGVKSFSLLPPGALPADFIEIDQVELIDENLGVFRIKFSVGGVLPLSSSSEIQSMEILATGVHIEDPNRPGIRIEK